MRHPKRNKTQRLTSPRRNRHLLRSCARYARRSLRYARRFTSCAACQPPPPPIAPRRTLTTALLPHRPEQPRRAPRVPTIRRLSLSPLVASATRPATLAIC